jgi:2'-5' RNA ligase
MTGEATARLFVAIELPRVVARELTAWARLVAASVGVAGRGHRTPRAAHAIRVLDADSLHLTLLFLGGRPLEEIDGLAAGLEWAAERAVECPLSSGAPIWLPPRHPRALAVEVHDHSGALADLQRDLAATLDSEEGRQARTHAGRLRGGAGRFRPHITVARTRAGTAVATEPATPTPQLSFMGRGAALYRSWLEPSGARYEQLARFPLAPPP